MFPLFLSPLIKQFGLEVNTVLSLQSAQEKMCLQNLILKEAVVMPLDIRMNRLIQISSFKMVRKFEPSKDDLCRHVFRGAKGAIISDYYIFSLK